MLHHIHNLHARHTRTPCGPITSRRYVRTAGIVSNHDDPKTTRQSFVIAVYSASCHVVAWNTSMGSPRSASFMISTPHTCTCLSTQNWRASAKVFKKISCTCDFVPLLPKNETFFLRPTHSTAFTRNAAHDRKMLPKLFFFATLWKIRYQSNDFCGLQEEVAGVATAVAIEAVLVDVDTSP